MVNTFVPYSDPRKIAKSLSMRHLTKQRVEAQQILNAIERPGKGWIHHPIVKAWQGCENGLKFYINCMIDEFEQRGGKNNMPRHDLSHLPQIVMPWWFNWERFHFNHRVMLMVKDPWHYVSIFQADGDIPREYFSCGYIWPHTIVSQSQLTAPLPEITAEQPEHIKNPIYCPVTYKNGNPCQVLLKDKKNRAVARCNRHIKDI